MKTILFSLAVGFMGLALATETRAQNPNYPGHLGVFVMPANGGMQIRSFIPDTPAQQLAEQGGISRGDIIVRLGGRRTLSLQELRSARNLIPEGKEAKMILRDPQGGMYHVWIWRSDAIAAAAAAPEGRAQSAPAPADQFRAGGRGEGKEGDFRDRGAKEGEPKEEGGNFRERK